MKEWIPGAVLQSIPICYYCMVKKSDFHFLHGEGGIRSIEQMDNKVSWLMSNAIVKNITV